jgi:ABC-type uncharacterized transport system permease subunit
MGLDANDLRLVTAVVVLAAIVGPGWLQGLARKRGAHAHA